MDELSGERRTDPIEADLRRVLVRARREWTPPPGLLDLDAVHRGADRRHRRRQGAVAAAAGLAVALVAAAAVVGLPGDGADRSRPPAATGPATPPSTSVSSTPTATSSRSSTPGTAVLAGFAPRSVSAVSPDSFWVLGTGCDGGCLAVAATVDGGATYRGVRVPGAVPRGGEVRFANRDDGWLFDGDGTLFGTSDGGATWTRVAMRTTNVPRAVTHLVATRDRVWAAAPYPPADNSASGLTALWSASTTGGAAWDLTLNLPSTVSDLAAQGERLLVLGGDGVLHTYRPRPGGLDARDIPGVCPPDLTGRLSATADSVWVVCATGTAAQVLRSADGTGPRSVDAGMLPNSAVVGARDARSAVAGVPGEGLRLVGDVAPRTLLRDAAPWSYVGFTTPDVGYAVAAGDAPRLLRTTDGGTTWTEVAVGG